MTPVPKKEFLVLVEKDATRLERNKLQKLKGDFTFVRLTKEQMRSFWRFYHRLRRKGRKF